MPRVRGGNRAAIALAMPPSSLRCRAGRVGAVLLAPVVRPFAASHASTSASANVGLFGGPPTGVGKSGCRRRQFDTAARPTPAILAMSAAVTSLLDVTSATPRIAPDDIVHTSVDSHQLGLDIMCTLFTCS